MLCPKMRDQRIAFAWINLSRIGDPFIPAPRPALKRDAGVARGDTQLRGSGGIRVDRGDAMFGLRPRDMAQQPRTGRFSGKIDSSRLGHGIKVDEAMFQRIGLVIREMATFYGEDVAA